MKTVTIEKKLPEITWKSGFHLEAGLPQSRSLSIATVVARVRPHAYINAVTIQERSMITVAIRWSGSVVPIPNPDEVSREALEGFSFKSRSHTCMEGKDIVSFIYLTAGGLKEMAVAVHAICRYLRDRHAITPGIWVEGDSLLTYAAQVEWQARRRGMIIKNAVAVIKRLRSIPGAAKQQLANLRIALEREGRCDWRGIETLPASDEG